jgi:hypothetical protein
MPGFFAFTLFFADSFSLSHMMADYSLIAMPLSLLPFLCFAIDITDYFIH